jgi:hypothetical protein
MEVQLLADTVPDLSLSYSNTNSVLITLRPLLGQSISRPLYWTSSKLPHDNNVPGHRVTSLPIAILLQSKY